MAEIVTNGYVDKKETEIITQIIINRKRSNYDALAKSLKVPKIDDFNGGKNMPNHKIVGPAGNMEGTFSGMKSGVTFCESINYRTNLLPEERKHQNEHLNKKRALLEQANKEKAKKEQDEWEEKQAEIFKKIQIERVKQERRKTEKNERAWPFRLICTPFYYTIAVFTAFCTITTFGALQGALLGLFWPLYFIYFIWLLAIPCG